MTKMKLERKTYERKIYWYWLSISICIMGIGIACDIGVNVTGFALFTVSESYMEYLFAAIVSVRLLEFSFIALVSGLLQEKFYGYKLSELTVFSGVRERINLRKYFTFSLVQIVLGMLCLSLFFRVSCANSMIYLLISALFSVGCMAYSIFDLMVNNQAVYDILEEAKDGDNTRTIVAKIIKRWPEHNGTVPAFLRTLLD